MTENNEQTIEFPGDIHLFRIGILAGYFGWLLIIIGLIRTGLSYFQYRLMGNLIFTGMSPLDLTSFILSIIQPLLSSIALWFLLRVAKEVLFLIIDIKDFVRENERE